MANSALWRQVSPEEREQIRKDSKQLLDEFAKKLEKIQTKEHHIENASGSREEGTGWQTDPEFRETTFANAPFTEQNFIVAEKGGWKK